MPNWTPQQQAAIADEGGTLLVSASAGSGKTAVLVERAFRLIAERGVAADRLLILTFSNAAAAELRSRIALRLEDALRREPQNLYLRRQRILLQRANISTVSAFCMQLLRENFSRLSIPPDFRVADESISYDLGHTVLASVLEDSYQDPAFCEFASVFGRARSDGAASDAILQLYQHLRALPFFESALAELCALYHGENSVCATPWGHELLKNAVDAATAGSSMCAAALHFIDDTPELLPYRDALLCDADCFLRVRQLLCDARWDDARIALATYEAPALKAVRGFDGREKTVVQELRKNAKALRDTLLTDTLVSSEAEFCCDRALLAPMVDALANAVRMFDQRFFEAKIAEKVLEFSDFEHLTLRLLLDENGKKSALAWEISARFDAVMVDEYQDTNALQDMLYRMLANDDESNLFLVGDVKQSIYRFRKAMPEIFIEKKERFARYDGTCHPASLILPHNFRSAPGVVDGINDIFSALMCRAVGEICYANGEELVAGAVESAVHGGLELHLVDTAQNKDFGEEDYVAELIVRMVREGITVRTAEGVRPCSYGDFCILLRSPAGAGEGFLAALRARGVPAHADVDSALLTQPAVQPLLAALRVLDNPAQDIPLAAALTSTMFGFSGAELAALRAETARGGLWGALCASSSEKAKQFCAQILSWRRISTLLPTAKLCEKLLSDTGYRLCAQVADAADSAAGAARLSALRGFVAFAADYDAAAGGGLAGFLRSVDSSISSGRALTGSGAVAPEGMVRLLSIHRSKGLEFPICILADTARQFNKQDLYAPVLLHTHLGIGMTLRSESGARYATVPQMAIRGVMEREQLSEEMRVLYVALTRAKDRVIITGASANSVATLEKLGVTLFGATGITPWMLQTARSFSQWLLEVALLHPSGEELRRAAGIASIALCDGSNGFCSKLVVAPPHSAEAAQCTAVRRTVPPDAQMVSELTTAFHWRYPREALLALPVKISVSALTHPAGSNAIPKRPSFMYGSGLSAAERGTALHAVLQYADFPSLGQNAHREVEKLCENGYILPEQAQAVDYEALGGFVSSELFGELLRADRVLREYAFFTHVPASMLQKDLPQELQNEPLLVQGIADCILIRGGKITLVDYKTDHGKTAEEFAATYRGQLALYKQAVEAGFGLPVVRSCLYAFSLGDTVEL